MPKNYFEDRSNFTKYSGFVNVGDRVLIIKKEDQGAKTKDVLVEGTVLRVLSKGKYYSNGVKVEITPVDNTKSSETVIGRIQYFVQN
ncbi:hypothetical protein KGF51_09935 [Clostridioides sp. ZZV14-6045]|uniref:hypothetical protein n=1 Tax=Clostridioides sp. ZZV14-6045 TaxID=2811489 RepID=UPI001D0F5875|nr:hypothetical protein [Clostridioides sp. ZZV14-6045]